VVLWWWCGEVAIRKEVKAKGCTACRHVVWDGMGGRVEPASSGGTQGGVARTWPACHGEVHRLPVGRQSKWTTDGSTGTPDLLLVLVPRSRVSRGISRVLLQRSPINFF
jgi:hypothetical protein